MRSWGLSWDRALGRKGLADGRRWVCLRVGTEECCQPRALTHGWSMCLRSLMGASSLSCSSRLHLSCPATGGMFL